MKQTAVEWLFLMLNNPNSNQEFANKLLEKAKEMEKENNIDFARHCLNKAKDLDILTAFMNTQQYYNETFKSE